jgi:hypothetical protein
MSKGNKQSVESQAALLKEAIKKLSLNEALEVYRHLDPRVQTLLGNVLHGWVVNFKVAARRGYAGEATQRKINALSSAAKKPKS